MECVEGRYTGYGVFDKYDFINAAASGVTLEEYMVKERSAGIRVVRRTGQSRNHYAVYEYWVNGMRFYGTSKTGLSRDILSKITNAPCLVKYDVMAPGRSYIDENDPVMLSIKYSIIAMVLGIISSSFSITVIPSIVMSIICIGFYNKAKSVSSVEPASMMNTVGLVFSIFGIVVSAIFAVIYVVLFVMYLYNV